MKNSSILTLVLLLSSFFLFGQQEFVFTYERTFPAGNENHLALDMDTLSGGGFVTLSMEKNAMGELRRINVTSHDFKGSIDWTNTYEYKRDYDLLPIGDISLTGDDSIAFSVVFDTIAYNRAITKIGLDGGYGWSKLYHSDGQIEENFEGRAELFNIFEEGIFHLTGISNSNGNSDILVSLVDYDGEIILNKSINSIASNGTGQEDIIMDAQTTRDSGVVALSNTASNIIITKMNRVGDVVWMRSYESVEDIYTSNRGMNITELVSGDLAVITESEQTDGTLDQGVMVVDSLGEVKVTYMFTSFQQTLTLHDVGGLLDTSIVFSGFRNGVLPGEGEPFMAHLNKDSTMNFSSFYRKSLVRDLGGFSAMPDGGAALFVSGGSFSTLELETPYLIRINDSGSTLCNQFFDLDIGFQDMTSSEVDFVETVIDGLTDTISVEAEEYNGFNPPTLTLGDTVFCPQDPIIYTIDATVPGAVGYLWSSNVPNPVGPVVTVTEEGEYSVTVTVGENVCYSLCDTTTITKKEFPMVQILPNFAQFCETGQAILAASANNAIVEIAWSTGVEDETRIGVTEPGTYSVSIVDDCGNPAQGSITLSQADFELDFPISAVLDRSTLCEDGTIRIVLDDFNAPPGPLTWSNGETGVTSIRVSEGGTYSVEYDGFCPGSASVTVQDGDFLEEATIGIASECVDDAILLISSGTGIIRVNWSTGEVSSSIFVNQVGTYTVTGTDECGDPVVAEIEITADDLDACGVTPPVTGEPCLEFPNAFVPNSREELNQFFAPKNDCGNLENYELRIYNRWGAEVFKTNNVDEGWNGRKGSKEAPNDVYFFYASYGTGGTMFEEKGDLLLIR